MKRFRSLFTTLYLSIISNAIATGQEDFTIYVDPTIGNISQLPGPTRKAAYSIRINAIICANSSKR